jgi:hypothetical protein
LYVYAFVSWSVVIFYFPAVVLLLLSLISEISKNEEQLQEYRYYKKFLEGLAPLVNTTGQHWMGVACK